MTIKAFCGLALLFTATPVAAVNWVTVYDEDPIWAEVDADSIHVDSDGLVYFQSEGGDKADQAADCQRGLLYTIKIYVMDGIYEPDWRNKGRPIVPGSAGEAMVSYACNHR